MKRSHAFKPTPIIPYRKASFQKTPDELYWQRLEKPVIIQEPGQVGTVDISPVEPYLIASTSSAKVQLYHPATCDSFKSLSRFKTAAHGAVFRYDGHLLASGDEEGCVRVFSVDKGSGTALRLFKGHESAVHAVGFSSGNNWVVSAADDRTVKCWDMGAADGSDPLFTLRGHNDHIRSLVTGKLNPNIVCTGSYDHSTMIWDTRSELMIGQLAHGCPVESVLLFPNENLVATAGGTVIRIWDLAAGGKQLAKVSQHHKTITDLKFSAKSNRLLSCGLDKHVKVYDATSYKVVYTYNFTAPILSVALAPNDSLMALGMAGGGSVAVLHMKAEKVVRNYPKKGGGLPTNSHDKNDTVVMEEAPVGNLRSYDVLLKKFQYSAALTSLLKTPFWARKRPEVIASFLKELDRRGGLERALGGRDETTLSLLIKFLRRSIERHLFPEIIFGTTELLLKIYGPYWMELDKEVLRQFRVLEERLEETQAYYKEMNEVIGGIDMILATSVSSEDSAVQSKKTKYFGAPSVTRIAF